MESCGSTAIVLYKGETQPTEENEEACALSKGETQPIEEDAGGWSFRDAVHCRDILRIRRCLEQSEVDVNRICYGTTALHAAAEKNDVALIQLLLLRKADINARDNLEDTAIHVAATEGHEAAIRILVDHGASVNIRNNMQQTPLHNAVDKANKSVVELLIKCGADVNAQDELSKSPLHLAAKTACIESIHFLMSNNANVLARDHHNLTPLHTANELGTTEMVRHAHGLCECTQNSARAEDMLSAVDTLGRTPGWRFKAPYMLSHNGQWPASQAPIYLIDKSGEMTIDVGNGQSLWPILQLTLNTLEHGDPYRGDSHNVVCLDRMQTYALNHFLNEGPLFDSNGSLPCPLLKCLNFVFSSVVDKPDLLVHTWPCNSVPDPQVIKDLLGLTGNFKEFCNQLLASPIGKCDLSSETSQSVYQNVTEFLDKLAAAAVEYDSMLQFHWKLAGSTAEGTKTGEPDEFDVLLMFDEISKYASTIDNNSFEVKPGEVSKFVSTHLKVLEHHGCSPSIRSGDLYDAIFYMLTSIMRDQHFWLRLDLSFVNFKAIKAGFALCLHSKGTNLYVKFDLVPCFIPCRSGPAHVFGKKIFRETSCLKENALLRELPQHAQTGYIIVKSILSPFLLCHILDKPILSDLVGLVAPSYYLKNALFVAFDHLKEGGFSVDCIEPSEWVRMILHEVLQENLGAVFERDPSYTYDFKSALSGGVPKQAHLNHYIRTQNNIPAFDDNMTALNFRDLIISAIRQHILTK